MSHCPMCELLNRKCEECEKPFYCEALDKRFNSVAEISQTRINELKKLKIMLGIKEDVIENNECIIEGYESMIEKYKEIIDLNMGGHKNRAILVCILCFIYIISMNAIFYAIATL